MPGVQYGSNTWFNFRLVPKKNHRLKRWSKWLLRFSWIY